MNILFFPFISHIDCAPVYLNEKAIGKVLKEWIDAGKVKREDLFITTKLPDTGEFIAMKQNKNPNKKLNYFCLMKKY